MSVTPWCCARRSSPASPPLAGLLVEAIRGGLVGFQEWKVAWISRPLLFCFIVYLRFHFLVYVSISGPVTCIPHFSCFLNICLVIQHEKKLSSWGKLRWGVALANISALKGVA